QIEARQGPRSAQGQGSRPRQGAGGLAQGTFAPPGSRGRPRGSSEIARMTDQPSDPRHDEPSLPDDAVIGRAFRRSSVALVALALLAGGVIWYLKRQPPAPPPQQTPLSAPVPAAQTSVEIPVARFTDITINAGIHFTHYNGAYGEKLLPETMGGGVAFFDFNN